MQSLKTTHFYLRRSNYKCHRSDVLHSIINRERKFESRNHEITQTDHVLNFELAYYGDCHGRRRLQYGICLKWKKSAA